MKEIYRQSVEEVLEELKTTDKGLTQREAAARQEKYGPNKLKEAAKATALQRFFKQLKDPMLIILLAAAAVSAATDFIAG